MVRSSLVALSVFVIACSSSGGPSGPSGPTGLQGPGSTSEEIEKNSYGVAYPSANIGLEARSSSRPGNVMKNFKFLGYKTSPAQPVTAGGQLENISLADYFDPESRNGHKILHITVSSVWCSPCNEEAKVMVQEAGELSTKGAIFLSALVDGPNVGTPATQANLDFWVRKHDVNYTMVLDPKLQAFAGFFDAAAVPFNANIDLRSMEILTAGTGAPPSLADDVNKWIKWANNNEPSYK